ncbi:uncharacterized protein LOC142324118 [Lycorma delicatula]|uniref:uncharacterized protein LOC142324118 n=1 Tax=Lycorma delicatula TaxID=130591 RepID=UPI003F517340
MPILFITWMYEICNHYFGFICFESSSTLFNKYYYIIMNRILEDNNLSSLFLCTFCLVISYLCSFYIISREKKRYDLMLAEMESIKESTQTSPSDTAMVKRYVSYLQQANNHTNFLVYAAKRKRINKLLDRETATIWNLPRSFKPYRYLEGVEFSWDNKKLTGREVSTMNNDCPVYSRVGKDCSRLKLSAESKESIFVTAFNSIQSSISCDVSNCRGSETNFDSNKPNFESSLLSNLTNCTETNTSTYKIEFFPFSISSNMTNSNKISRYNPNFINSRKYKSLNLSRYSNNTNYLRMKLLRSKKEVCAPSNRRGSKTNSDSDESNYKSSPKDLTNFRRAKKSTCEVKFIPSLSSNTSTSSRNSKFNPIFLNSSEYKSLNLSKFSNNTNYLRMKLLRNKQESLKTQKKTNKHYVIKTESV